MLRQRIYYSRRTHVFPDDFTQRLERFKVESGLSWAEIARCLGTYPLTIRRWRYKGVRPNLAHQTALPDLADDLGLGHLLTDWVGAPGEGLRSQGLPTNSRGAPTSVSRLCTARIRAQKC